MALLLSYAPLCFFFLSNYDATLSNEIPSPAYLGPDAPFFLSILLLSFFSLFDRMIV
jgi:hypothetical protein